MSADRQPDTDFVVLPRTTLLEFLGEMALPPWTDERGRQIGTGINCAPIAQRLSDWLDEHDLSSVIAAAPDLAFQVERLQAWKDEALVVLEQWETVHAALGSPGALGTSKPVAAAAQVAILRAAIPLLQEARAEIDKWGYGDFHYGDTPRDEGVLAMLAKIDGFLLLASVFPSKIGITDQPDGGS